MVAIIRLMSWLRYARYLSCLAFVLAPVFINDYRTEDYDNQTIIFIIANILKPHKDWGLVFVLLRDNILGCV